MSDSTLPDSSLQEIPYGYCRCGCGRKTTVAKWNDKCSNRVKGQPVRYIRGHHKKSPGVINNIQAAYVVNETTGCWEWNRHLDGHGYGQIKVHGKNISAYRYLYEIKNGPTPAKHHLHHICENPLCINPYHLELMTATEHKRYHSDFSMELAVEVRELAALGITYEKIAAEYKISRSMVGRIVRRQNWNELSEWEETNDGK